MNDKEKIKKAAMSDGNYISSSDMKEIDGLCNSWWQESPYELKATVQQDTMDDEQKCNGKYWWCCSRCLRLLVKDLRAIVRPPKDTD